MLVKLEKRKTKSQSRRKITSAINLYEQYVDEKFKSIKIISDTYYYFNTDYYTYSVNISTNKVDKTYPDPDFKN